MKLQVEFDKEHRAHLDKEYGCQLTDWPVCVYTSTWRFKYFCALTCLFCVIGWIGMVSSSSPSFSQKVFSGMIGVYLFDFVFLNNVEGV